MLQRILNIAHKDLLHLWHNRLLLVLVIFGAATELLLIGFATGADIDNLRLVVIDHDATTTSAGLTEALDDTAALNLDDNGTDVFDKHDNRDDALDDLFTGGDYVFNPDTVILVEIPAGFEDSLRAGDQPEVAITLNGANSLPARTARRAAEETLYRYGAVQVARFAAEESGVVLTAESAQSLEDRVLTRLDNATPTVTVRYNEELERSHYTTPSEAAFILYIITAMVAALMLAREREHGTFEQLLVMPQRPMEIIAGKALPAVMVGYANFILVLIIMNVVFDVPVRGSLPLLLILAVAYLLVELGRGFLAALIAHTQNQVLMIVMLMAFVDITFSGYAIPVESMPGPMQALANLFPIRHWMIILRGILQKDVGLSVLWPQLVWLAVLGIAINSVTLWTFRRSLGETR